MSAAPSASPSTAAAASLVSLSIVSHAQTALVESLLGDLVGCDSPALAHLIVTLNTADEPMPRVPEPLAARTQIVRNARPRSFAANHNAAFGSCTTPWFALLNPDLRLPVDPFRPLLAAAQPRDALLAPQVRGPDGSMADSARALITPAQVLVPGEPGRRLRHGADIDWIAGMFWLVRAEAMHALGGLDEGYRMYCEDADFCLRLQLAGWSLRVVEGVTVEHAARRASRRSPRYFAWHVASLLRHWTSAPYARYRRERAAIRAREAAAGG